jgi:4-hydroxybenzoate polyprenyltransferase
MNNLSLNKYINLLRLNKPTGLFLLLCPTIFSVLIATHSHPNSWLLFKFILGAILMRSAGCIINDLIDKDIDIQVKRTKNRAIASGIISQKEVYMILGSILFIAFCILITLSIKTIILGCLAIIPIVIYPFLKRITFFPQIFLGFTFNLGTLLAFVEATGRVGSNGWILYLCLSVWTISYDTIYAFQDIEDDIKAGVKSSAIALGDKTPIVLEFLNTLATLLLVLTGIFNHLNFGYFIFVVLILLIFLWQKSRLDINDPKSCELIFNSNFLIAILLVIAGINA